MIKYRLRSQDIFPIGKRESFRLNSEECYLMKEALEQAEEDLEYAVHLLEIADNKLEENPQVLKHIHLFLEKFKMAE